MVDTIIVELPSGRKVQFGGGGVGGLGEIGLGEDVAEAGTKAFKAALGTLGDVVAVLEESVGRLARRPDKVEIEFGASLTGQADLWIVSGDAKAEFKVKLAWEKPKAGKSE
jgi:hypothetical protein